MEIERILEEVAADLAEAEAEVQRLNARITELRQIQQGLIYAQERYGTPRSTPTGQAVAFNGEVIYVETLSESEQWKFLSLKDAVVRVMQELGHPATTEEVWRALQAHDRPESYASVRASLNYIKRSSGGRTIASLRAGLWALPASSSTDALTDAEAPVSAGASGSEEPEEGSSRKEGGSVDGTEPPDGRDGSGDTELRHGHGDRAPLVGVPG